MHTRIALCVCVCVWPQVALQQRYLIDTHCLPTCRIYSALDDRVAFCANPIFASSPGAAGSDANGGGKGSQEWKTKS